LLTVDADNRVRGSLRYHAAATGRWSGRGYQPQNLKRAEIKDTDAAVDAVLSGDVNRVRELGAPLTIAGDVQRSIICAAPGHKLIAGDFSAIESRVLAWLANEKWKLEIYRKYDETGDPKLEPYCVLASQALRRPVTPDQEDDRQIGKTYDLAFGFGGGRGAWRKFDNSDTYTDAEIESFKNQFRRTHPATVRFWHALALTGRRTIRTKRPHALERLSFATENGTLFMVLPSGRRLAYPEARVVPGKFEDTWSIRHKDNARGKWSDVDDWYGTTIENAVQATARDLLVAAMLRLEAAGYAIVLHVHDEIVCEVPEDFGSEEEFKRLLLEPPEWAAGLPIAGKVRSGKRYAKSATRQPTTSTTQVELTQPQDGFSGDTEIRTNPNFRTSDLPTGSSSGQNPADAENGGDRAAEVHICAQCRLDPPDGSERPSTYNGLWLHAHCEDAFIHARMTEEGLVWSNPNSSASTPPPTEKPPDGPPPRSSGNGHAADRFNDAAEEEFASDDDDGNGYARGEAHKGTTAAAYIYKDATGRNHMRVVRTTAKTFPTYHWDRGAWILGWPRHVVPYRLPELIAAPPSEPVWICEGEKDTNNVAALELIATTNPGGAGKWQRDLTQWFKGKEVVYLLEDNDESGRKHTAIVTAALRDVVPTIITISFPELPEKGDVSDWLEIGGNRALLIARAKIERERQSTQDVHIINLATVRSRAIKWLWPGHLARGGLELMAGTPEIGKSQIQCQYIAHLTTGRDWPDGMPGIPPCRIIMITAEDTTADTIVPRLKAAGANLALVEQLHAIRRNGRDEMFLLGEDLERLARLVRHFGDVGLIAIDPITAYMGSNKHFDSHRATDVRSQLMPLKRFAEEFEIGISAITHPPKNASAQALDHFIGSQAFIATARIGHLCLIEMEEDEDGKRIPTGRRLFTNPKINIAVRQPTLAYSINVVDVEPDEETGAMIRAPVIQWEGEVAITAEEALAASRPTRGKGRKTVEVDEFLHDILTGGPVLVTVIKARAAAHGFSEDQLRRARERLNVIAFKEKVFGARSKWALPQHAPSLEEREDEIDGKQK
jgi:hypothetical protein